MLSALFLVLPFATTGVLGVLMARILDPAGERADHSAGEPVAELPISDRP